MSDAQALAQAAGRSVSRETFDRLTLYSDRLAQESTRQNLVSRSTIQDLWTRHILDSAQLVRFEPNSGCRWIDIGSGAGLPGLVIAILVDGPITLVEPRRLRADFLLQMIGELGLGERVSVEPRKSTNVAGRFEVITGRAVAALEKFLTLSHHLSTKNSLWVLPKGQNAQSELAEAQRNWQFRCQVEQSVTDPNSRILLLDRVGARQKR